jgi:hypothetical protein
MYGILNPTDPKMGAAKIQQRRPKSLIRKGLPESLPTSVQKSYFLLGAKERDVSIALSKNIATDDLSPF